MIHFSLFSPSALQRSLLRPAFLGGIGADNDMTLTILPLFLVPN